MKPKPISEALFSLIFSSAAFMLIFQLFGFEKPASALFYLSFVLVALVWFFVSYHSFKKLDLLLWFIVAFSLVGILFSLSADNSAISFEPFKKYIMFILALAFFTAICKFSPNRNFRTMIHFLNSLLVLSFLFVYIFKKSECYLYNGIESDYLVFGLDNPNKAAMFLLSFGMMELSGSFFAAKIKTKLIHLALFGVAFYFLLETGSRNSLLSMAAFVLFLIATKIPFFKNMQKSRLFALSVALWPLIFAATYLLFVNNPALKNALSFLAEEGKGIDSRVAVWQRALQIIFTSPVFGAYFKMNQLTGHGHMHNTHIDTGVSYGVLVLILVCALLYLVIRKSAFEADEKSKSYFFAFCSMVIMGMGESAIFTGGFGIYIFAAEFLLLCKNKTPLERSVDYKWK